MYQEIWPEAFIQLQREMNFHPALIAQISQIPQKPSTMENLGLILAEICTYCGYAIDHTFQDDEELEALCDMLLKKLQLIDGRTRAAAAGIPLH